jgi:hypothetical protein
MVPILNLDQLLVVLKSTFNNKPMYMNTRIIAIVFAVLLFGSCKKDFLDRKPISDLTEGNFFKTGADAESALYAAYSSFQSEYYIFDNYINNDVISDNCYSGGDNPNNFQLDGFTTTPLNGNVSRDWAYLYDAISRANAVLDNVPNINSSDLTAVRKSQILGEASFLRAFQYFQLVNLYGEVPLVLHKLNSTDPDVVYHSKKPVSDIYASIISDLKFAADNVPVVYADKKQRITKGACNAMLAKVYASKPNPDWNSVLQYAEAVTGTTTYKLVNDFSQLWDGTKENTTESILEIQFIAGGAQGNWGPQLWLPPSLTGDAWRKFNTPSNDLIAAYTSQNDTVRMNASILFQNNLPWTDPHFPDGKIPFPYKQRSANGWASGNNYILLRLADIILLQAEAKNELGNLAGAQSDLNIIRNRVFLANTTANSQGDLRDAIALERRLELAFEGHRWFDLKRTGKAISTMNALGLGYNVDANKLLLPIPQNELDRNPKLTQNPGY